MNPKTTGTTVENPAYDDFNPGIDGGGGYIDVEGAEKNVEPVNAKVRQAKEYKADMSHLYDSDDDTGDHRSATETKKVPVKKKHSSVKKGKPDIGVDAERKTKSVKKAKGSVKKDNGDVGIDPVKTKADFDGTRPSVEDKFTTAVARTSDSNSDSDEFGFGEAGFDDSHSDDVESEFGGGYVDVSGGNDVTRAPGDIQVGDRVVVEGFSCAGTLRFIGVHHEKGLPRAGVELDLPIGKNNGTVSGHTYFRCDPNKGVLVLPKKVTLFGFPGPRSNTTKPQEPDLVAEIANEPLYFDQFEFG